MAEKDPFGEYIKESDPDRAALGYAWNTAVGLQAVDGLKPSVYLIETAVRNIEGEISLKDAQHLIDTYYEERPTHIPDDERTEEADKVSARIAEILSENAFSFTSNEYISIHRRLFSGLYAHAGKIRDYNITKKEWVLDGATVIYGSASELKATLEYDISVEREFSYKGLSMEQIIHHLAVFVSGLWQIHIFGEGNTRTTAVFFIKYLRQLGFSAENEIFAENAWFFRNALVRANYTDLKNGVHETTQFLELFLENLLLNANHKLKSRNLHISLASEEKENIEDKKVDIQGRKVDIYGQKVDIQRRKAVIDELLIEKPFTVKTTIHIYRMYAVFGSDGVFSRKDVIQILQLKPSGASKFLSNMMKAGVIEPVTGKGKGKYRFAKDKGTDEQTDTSIG